MNKRRNLLFQWDIIPGVGTSVRIKVSETKQTQIKGDMEQDTTKCMLHPSYLITGKSFENICTIFYFNHFRNIPLKNTWEFVLICPTMHAEKHLSPSYLGP